MTNLTQRQLPTPREIVAHLDLFVFGQELAKRDLAVAFYNHYLGIGYHDHHPVAAAAAPTRSQAGSPFGKQHILLMGPTGSGKTYLIRLIAEFLGVPYTTVMLAAAIPAFLYYLALLMAVHFEAKKLGLKGLSKENIPDAMLVIKTRGHLIIPLVVLMAVMFMGYTPLYAATLSIISTVVASWLSRTGTP